MDQELLHVVLRLLEHSWKDINYDYAFLTDSERKLVTKDQFSRLVVMIEALRNARG